MTTMERQELYNHGLGPNCDGTVVVPPPPTEE